MSKRRQVFRVGGALAAVALIIITWLRATKQLYLEPPTFLGIELVTAVALIGSTVLFLLVGATALIEARNPSLGKKLFLGSSIILGIFIAVTIFSVGILFVVPFLLTLLSGREDTQQASQGSGR